MPKNYSCTLLILLMSFPVVTSQTAQASVIEQLNLLPSDIAAADNGLTTRSYTLTEDSVIVGPSDTAIQISPRDVEYGSIELFESGVLDHSNHYRVTVEVKERRSNPPGTSDFNDTSIGVRSGDFGLVVINSDNFNFNGSNVEGLTPILGCNFTGESCFRADVNLLEPISNLSDYTIVFDLQKASATATLFDNLNASSDSLSYTLDGLFLDVSKGLSLTLIGNHQYEIYEFLSIDVQVEQIPEPSSFFIFIFGFLTIPLMSLQRTVSPHHIV